MISITSSSISSGEYKISAIYFDREKAVEEIKACGDYQTPLIKLSGTHIPQSR